MTQGAPSFTSEKVKGIKSNFRYEALVLDSFSVVMLYNKRHVYCMGVCLCSVQWWDWHFMTVYSCLNAFWRGGGVQMDGAMDRCHHHSPISHSAEAEWERLQRSFGQRADGADSFLDVMHSGVKDDITDFLCCFIWIDACYVCVFICIYICFIICGMDSSH